MDWLDFVLLDGVGVEQSEEEGKGIFTYDDENINVGVYFDLDELDGSSLWTNREIIEELQELAIEEYEKLK